MLRFPGLIPEDLDSGTWTQRTGHLLKLWLIGAQEAIGGSQQTPDPPSEIQAGVAASTGTSQAPAASDIVHSVDTAAPSVPIALGGSVSEGTGTALLRADATNKLAQGGAADKDFLVWDTATLAWVPRPVGFSDSVLGQRAFSAPRVTGRAEPGESEVMFAARAFSAQRQQHIPGPDDANVVLASRIFGR